MPICREEGCTKSINRGQRCTKHSNEHVRKRRRGFRVINCPYKGKGGCGNNGGKGFQHNQALKVHIMWKHQDMSQAEKMEGRGTAVSKDRPILPAEEKKPTIVPIPAPMPQSPPQPMKVPADEDDDETPEPDDDDDDWAF